MTCKDCVHYDACGGFTPTDLDQDVFDYCVKGTTDEIPYIDKRCGSFKNKADFVEVVRCKDCDVPHNKWLGCPYLNGLIPPPDFYCAKGTPKERGADK